MREAAVEAEGARLSRMSWGGFALRRAGGAGYTPERQAPVDTAWRAAAMLDRSPSRQKDGRMFPTYSPQSQRLRAQALRKVEETPSLRDRMLAGVRTTGVRTNLQHDALTRWG